MTETEFADSYALALTLADRLKVVVGDERDEVLQTLSETALVVRNTAIREHLSACSIHAECGWDGVQEPNNPLNDYTWEGAWRQGLLSEAAEGIRTGTIAPWLPVPRPVFSDLPFYRAR